MGKTARERAPEGMGKREIELVLEQRPKDGHVACKCI